MRTIFTLIAALSALICLAVLGLTVITLGKQKTFGVGEDAEHNFAIKFDGLAIDYLGRLKTFGPRGFETKTDKKWGITIDHQIRAADPRHKMTAAEGKLIEIPSLYPIAVFGVLPLIWVLSALGNKNKPIAADSAAAPAA